MKPCDLPVAVFVQGWLMILAGIQQSLTDEALNAAINRTVFVVSANPRFELSAEQATEIVGVQLIALANQNTDSDVRAFAERYLNVLLREAVSDN
ncbi:MAG TPA: hypothetical protein VMG10_05640 [Gemmataceae bacterium]|nr:hypothetical protein [Gemmataceae bacterium]